MSVLPCIVCKRELKDIGSGSENHANDACEFQSYGQYGSTVFDPMDGTYLVANICDECLKAATDAGHLMLGRQAPAPRHLSKYPEKWTLVSEPE